MCRFWTGFSARWCCIMWISVSVFLFMYEWHFIYIYIFFKSSPLSLDGWWGKGWFQSYLVSLFTLSDTGLFAGANDDTLCLISNIWLLTTCQGLFCLLSLGRRWVLAPFQCLHLVQWLTIVQMGLLFCCSYRSVWGGGSGGCWGVVRWP